MNEEFQSEHNAVHRFIHRAICEDAPQLLQLLLGRCGVSLDTPIQLRRDNHHQHLPLLTVLETAVCSGSGKCLEWLFKEGQLDREQCARALMTMMHWLGHPTAGVKVDYKQVERFAKHLLAAGARPSVACFAKAAPFRHRFSQTFLSTLLPIRVAPDAINDFMERVCQNLKAPSDADFPSLLSELMARGADPAFSPPSARSAFHCAVHINSIHACTWLLQQGVDPWRPRLPRGTKAKALSAELRGSVGEKAVMREFLRTAKASLALASTVAATCARQRTVPRREDTRGIRPRL